MIYGIISILILVGIIVYLDYRIAKLENKFNQLNAVQHILMYDYLKRNKKKVKGIKIEGNVNIDEIFK